MFDETVIKNPFEKVKRKNPLNSKTASSFFCMLQSSWKHQNYLQIMTIQRSTGREPLVQNLARVYILHTTIWVW